MENSSRGALSGVDASHAWALLVNSPGDLNPGPTVRTIALQEVAAVGQETINMRTDSERKRRLQTAADLSHMSLSAFVLSAADERAQHVIDQQSATSLPAHFYDDFFDSLAAPPASTLVDAAGRLPGIVWRGD